MEKDFYDKYGKEFHCGDCQYLEYCLKSEEPLINSCREEFLSCEVSRKDQRIADLEEQLKNAIVPKYKDGQKIYILIGEHIWQEEYAGENTEEIIAIERSGCNCCPDIWSFYRKEDVFATKEEAEAMLKELQGE